MHKKITLVLICLFFTHSSIAQRAGSLDTTFNHDGIVHTQVVGDTINQANAVAIQSNGKIVVAGLTANYDSYLQNFAILRYNINGSLDTSFNKTGYVVVLLDSNFYAEFNAVVIQPNGKILAGGYEYPLVGKESFVLMRFDTDGDFDTTFGNNGIVKDTVNGDITSIALQADGKIVAGGIYNNSTSILARYDSSGSLDSTFGDDGFAITDIAFSLPGFICGLALQSDNKIVTAGYFYSNINQSIVLARYNTDGSLDTTFGLDGIDTANYAVYEEDKLNAIAIQNDGKIVVGGYVERLSNNGPGTMAIIRYNTNGSFDTSFGVNGLDTSSFDGPATSLLLQPDGKIIATGFHFTNLNFALLRCNTIGTMDTSFGNGGESTNYFPSFSFAESAALQSDGKIVAAGYSGYPYEFGKYFVLARYNNDISTGILNFSSPQTTTILTYPNPVHNTETLDYTLTNNETLTINLYNITGQLVRNYLTGENVLSGEHKQQLNFDNLASGTYILSISNADLRTESIKVVKE